MSTVTPLGITSRPPTALVPYPCVLLEGEEKAGKTWLAMMLAASERVSMTYWLDLQEGAADEYGAVVLCQHCRRSVIEPVEGWGPQVWVHGSTWDAACEPDSDDTAYAEPGVRLAEHYEVLVHDGSYGEILARVQWAWREAKRRKDAGEPPVLLIVDTMTALWEALKDWVTRRMNARLRAQGLTPGDADKADGDLWQDAKDRHRAIVTLLLTFPGIVVMTARGKAVAKVEDGAFVPGQQDWSVQAEPGLKFDATVWIRMRRDRPAEVVGARSVYLGVRPAEDRPRPLPEGWSLEWLIFTAMRVNPATAHVRDYKVVDGGGGVTADEQARARADVADEGNRALATAVQAPVKAAPAKRAAAGRKTAPAAEDSVLAHAWGIDADGAADMLRYEIKVLAEVLGSTPEQQSARWSAARNTTLDVADAPALLALVKTMRPRAVTRLTNAGRTVEADGLQRYVGHDGPVDVQAVLAGALEALSPAQ